MLKTFPNIDILYNLKEITLIGGTSKTLKFNLYKNKKNDNEVYEDIPLNNVAINPTWELYPFHKDDFPIIFKVATCINGNSYIVELETDDTKNLQGRYIQKFSLTGIKTYEQKIAEGIVNIIPRIGITGEAYNG